MWSRDETQALITQYEARPELCDEKSPCMYYTFTYNNNNNIFR